MNLEQHQCASEQKPGESARRSSEKRETRRAKDEARRLALPRLGELPLDRILAGIPKGRMLWQGGGKGPASPPYEKWVPYTYESYLFTLPDGDRFITYDCTKQEARRRVHMVLFNEYVEKHREDIRKNGPAEAHKICNRLPRGTTVVEYDCYWPYEIRQSVEARRKEAQEKK